MSISNLVPLPRSVEQVPGANFPVYRDLLVSCEDEGLLGRLLPRIEKALDGGGPGGPTTQVKLVIDEDFHEQNPGLVDATGQTSDEAYLLVVSADEVRIAAPSEAGLHRAISTLTQLVETNRDGSLGIPQCRILDAPRYGWRGLSMDVSRSFYTVDEIKKLIDLMALYRMNTLHMHLSDDQGWRLEVAGLPRLTEISGKTASEGSRSGYYTADEFRELARYGSARGIALLPEFDIPGHTNAASHAYGELMPDGEPTDAYTGDEVGFSKLYPSVPFTKEFMLDIFDVASQLSTSDYVHVGGDEALEQSDEDYRLLVEEAAGFVTSNGKLVVGWQEVATANLPEGSVIQYWKHNVDLGPIVEATKLGHRVLMSPAPHAYLDMKYDDSTPYGQDWAGVIELDRAYDWNPAKQIKGVGEANIVGVEAGMWTERIRNLNQLMYMLLPRISAIAEVAWTPQEQRDLDDYRSRVAGHCEYWDAAGLNWHRSPGVDWLS